MFTKSFHFITVISVTRYLKTILFYDTILQNGDKKERRNKMADNDILEEQRKARQNYLELKKMQQGELAPEPKPSEMAVEPKTFKEKWQNYWFHNKWQTIGAAFLVVVLTVLIAQCANREKYDFQVVFFTYDVCLDDQLGKVEEYIESYATDIDGDGKVNVSVINCSFSDESNDTYKNTMLSKVQAQVAANEDAVLYLVDEDGYEYFSGVVEGGLFDGEPLELGEDFYEYTESEDWGKLPEGLKLAIRRISDTTLAENEKANTLYKECTQVLEKMKKDK